MSKVGIFRLVVPAVSEPFILDQAKWLRNYTPVFFTKRKTAPLPFETVAVSEGDDRYRQRLYALSRSPQFFDRKALEGIRLIHAHFGPDAVYALPLASRIDVPLVTTFHGFDVTTDHSRFLTSGGIGDKYYYFCQESLKRKGALFIAVSDFIRECLLKKGFPGERVIRHYIGVDVDAIRISSAPATERYILCVGRHSEVKGIDNLLEAFASISAKHPEVRLLQVGTGPMTRSLQMIVERHGLGGRVVFLGSQPHHEVLRLMRGAELFALTSRTAQSGAVEALGIVFNEASATGIPVVSTQHGGIPEAVIDNETGLLAHEADIDGIAQRLDFLLHDRAYARKLGLRGREYVGDQFNIKKQTSQLELIYDKLLFGKP